MKNLFLSIIIPCYNEENNLKRGVLTEVYDYIKTKKFSWEVIISDDGSTDSSRELAKEKIKYLDNFRLLENPHGGKPSTLFYGIKAAKAQYVLFCDMDLSTPITELDKLLPHLKNYDVIIGSRGRSRKNFPLYRRLGSVVFMTFRKLLILKEINDTQCGFKLFKRQALLDSFPKLELFKKKNRPSGWKVTSYDVELLHIIKKKGYTIKEVTVKWQDEDTSKSKGGGLERYFKESQDMLFQILKVKLNDIKGLYS